MVPDLAKLLTDPHYETLRTELRNPWVWRMWVTAIKAAPADTYVFFMLDGKCVSRGEVKLLMTHMQVAGTAPGVY